MSRLLLLTIFWGIHLVLSAQDDACQYTISGTVIDEHDQSPLAFATVFVNELNRGVVADSSGFYTLGDLCAETYTLVVSHVSCRPVTTPVEVRGNAKKDLFLEHHIEALHSLTIEGSSLNTAINSAASSRMHLETLEQYSANSLGDALAELTGVSTFKTGKTLVKPVVQGLYGSRILIVNQGVRLQDMEWGEEHAPNVDINSAGAITLVKGASALRYGGDAIGGTIIIEPTALEQDTVYGKALLTGATNGRGGSFNTDVFISNHNGWFAKLQGSVKRFGDFKAPDYYLTNTGSFEKGASFHGGRFETNGGFDLYYSFFQAELAILRSSHIGNIDDLVNSLNSLEPLVIEDFSYSVDQPKQKVTHHLARVKYHQHWGDANVLEAQYDFQYNQRFEFDIRIGADRDVPALDLALTTHTVSTHVAFNQEATWPLEGGLLYRFQDNFADPDTGIRRLVPDYQRFEFGGYLTTTHQINALLAINGGIRYDFNRINAKKFYQTSRWEERGYEADFGDKVLEVLPTQLLVNPILDFHNVSGTVGLNYNWSANKKLHVNYALAQRSPNPSELFSDGLHQSASRIELGELRSSQETSHKLMAVISDQRDFISWEVSPYINQIRGFILLEPAGVEQTIRGAFPVWEYRQADAQLWGVDAQLQVKWGNNTWTSTHKFSYLHGQDTENDRPLINMPPPNFSNRVTYVFKPWYNLSLSLESIVHFKQKRFPNNNFQAFLPLADEFLEVDISTPPPSYQLINFYGSVLLAQKDSKKFEVGFSILNLFDTTYRDYLNRLRFFGDETGRSFEVSLKFNY